MSNSPKNNKIKSFKNKRFVDQNKFDPTNVPIFALAAATSSIPFMLYGVANVILERSAGELAVWAFVSVAGYFSTMAAGNVLDNRQSVRETTRIELDTLRKEQTNLKSQNSIRELDTLIDDFVQDVQSRTS